VGSKREALLVDGRLEWVLFVTKAGRLPPRAWLADLFQNAVLSSADRAALLAGAPAGALPDEGPLVCACRKVGAKTIARAMTSGAADVDAITAATGAGSNCGSCRIELARLLTAHAAETSKKEMAHV
jgi:assimilatory nitrate reductase catalytic subunit